jgi:pimeloyl-ACP methyl ester carboxylesterase
MATPQKTRGLRLTRWVFQWSLGLFWAIAIGPWDVRAEVISVAPVETCFLCNTAPTLTFYWPSAQAEAVLIYLPGGDGHFGLKVGQTRLYNRFTHFLSTLSNPRFTEGKVSVVLMDSPEPLSPNQMYPTARTNEDHMIRILSVIEFYRSKTQRPVWLMGHSAGGISLSKFVDFLKAHQKEKLLGGLIASGVRNESYLDRPIPWPTLVIHHRDDGCFLTKPEYARRLFDQLKANSSRQAEFALIEGGEPEDDPCTGGYHMFYQIESVFVSEVERFMLRENRGSEVGQVQ